MEEMSELNRRVKAALEAHGAFSFTAPVPAEAPRRRRFRALRWALPTAIAASVMLMLALPGLVVPAEKAAESPRAAVAEERVAPAEMAAGAAGVGATDELEETLSFLLEAGGVDADTWTTYSPEELLLAWQEAPYVGEDEQTTTL